MGKIFRKNKKKDFGIPTGEDLKRVGGDLSLAFGEDHVSDEELHETMDNNDEPKSCSDDCGCEEQHNRPTYAPDYQSEGESIETSHLSISGNTNNLTGSPTNTLSDDCDDGQCQGDKKEKMHDLVVKQMGYGYLVKAGCQTLCIETPDNLVALFSEYVRDPEKVTRLHNCGKLDKIYEERQLDTMTELRKRIAEISEAEKNKKEVCIAVVGNSLNDVRDYLSDVVPVAVRASGAMRKYELETPEHVLRYYAITGVEHIRAMVFDKVVETHRARDNKVFPQIIMRIRKS